MHASLLLAATFSVAGVLGAPAYPEINAKNAIPQALDSASQYFNLLAQKVKTSRDATLVCDVSLAQLPTSSVSPALPPPSEGLVVKHVAIGRGTQNYTCDTANATAVPVANGAVATLFNASCLAAAYPDLLSTLPSIALLYNLTTLSGSDFADRLYPSNLVVSGHHYFTDATTPFFDLDSPTLQIGRAACAKNSSQAAPTTATTTTASTSLAAGSSSSSSGSTSLSSSSNLGQKGEAAVPWLKLLAKDLADATGNLREVYRVETVGGSAPSTCAGMPATFEVQYAAQYWFYESV